jgi:hypothetical protein
VWAGCWLSLAGQEEGAGSGQSGHSKGTQEHSTSCFTRQRSRGTSPFLAGTPVSGFDLCSMPGRPGLGGKPTECLCSFLLPGVRQI